MVSVFNTRMCPVPAFNIHPGLVVNFGECSVQKLRLDVSRHYQGLPTFYIDARQRYKCLSNGDQGRAVLVQPSRSSWQFPGDS